MKSKLPADIEKRFYELPFEVGTRILTRATLDANSDIRKPKQRFFSIEINKVEFFNEVLTYTIRIEDEPQEKVYLKVTEKALMISCSVDTDYSYLSRYSYFLLDKLMYYYISKDFTDYYWPDFFNPDTGKSSFLRVTSNSKTVSVNLTSKYDYFFRPGFILPEIPNNNPLRKTILNKDTKDCFSPFDQEIIAYGVTEMNKELTMLLPFTGTLTKDRRSVKSMISYLVPKMPKNFVNAYEDNEQLTEICLRMWHNTNYYAQNIKKVGNEDPVRVNDLERKQRLFDMWVEAMPYLANQNFVYYQYRGYIRYIAKVIKPTKKDFYRICVSSHVPELIFYLSEYKEHYSLKLKFSINDKPIQFAEFKAYFFATDDKTNTFYLLGSLADAEIVDFFRYADFNIPVLKTHFEKHFKPFVDQIGKCYKLIRGKAN